MIRRAAAGLLVVGVVAALGACAAPAAAPSPSATTASPTPSPTPTDPVKAEIDERLAQLSVRDKVASLMMLHYPGTDGAALNGFMASTGAGGFIVMGDNVGGGVDQIAATTASLTVDPTLPPLVAVDQEGGYVARIDEDDLPAAEQLRAEPAEATQAAFRGRADLIARAGIDMNFGIVADVTADPDSFIFDRVLGTTPEDSAARVEQAVLGESGVTMSTLKHFPGHGRSDSDSHVSVPSTDVGFDEWRATDALPFERGIAAKAEAVMFGHLAYTAVDPQPASLSTRWHEVLRDDLGFDGLAVTDDMLMLQHSGVAEFQDPVENAVRAVEAGNDVLVYVLAADPEVSGVDPIALVDGVTAAVETGRIPMETLDDAARRVLAARIAAR
ncbi:glycoside hydrolase family 3 N-terminal domain-containing protein [Herbiconiux sp. L3-i23]|uniref:glycoside hydrolase family 3 N-terminal domain-containing protein n=1 Tax=Herbiconiux sp. L3-i23 TaxID=2905871 RepID=UPI00206DCDF1|nr:glycoside hydrolase family 3 N-terminal domain-containing protein [Herbiconiux sp. L3-i23]BDI23110.1 beta-N-acetylhexosaminidase [Herbiconiux sp. L3-i23]